MLVIHEVIDAAPVFIRTDRLVLAVAIEIDGVIADVVVNAVHDEVHAAFLHFRREFLEVLRRTKERVNRAVVDGIVAVVRAGVVNRVDVNRRDAEALQIVELLRDAGDIAAKEIIALPFIAIGSRRLAVVGRQRIPFAVLDRLEAACIFARIVVALIAIKEAVWENLIADGFLGPIRRLEVFAVDRQLIRLNAAQLKLPRMARLRVIAVFLRVVKQEFIAIEPYDCGVNVTDQKSCPSFVPTFVIG